MYDTIDNLVPSEIIDDIERVLLSYDFPWYLNRSVINKNDSKDSTVSDSNTVDSNQFTHIFASNNEIRSPFFHLIAPLPILLGKHIGKDFTRRIIRIKANLLMKQESFPDNCYTFPHTDSNSIPGESLLYYVNDSDGDTFMFNEKRGTVFNNLTVNKRITPKKGRCLFFDSDYYHSSSCPRKSDFRVAINFLFNK